MARMDTSERIPTPEEIDAARRKWSERTGVPFDEVPWQVTFLSDRPITAREEDWARGVMEEMVDAKPI
jgi:hypothetical protein